ncbi:alpha/beta fold hydrolase [Nocardia bovistercoris]|uniref:Alpha/beta fold hydrolase n=1 Tax=Nocardia bovistercoris TaxID=2785916 RepID=A0A931IEC5_9NOCA|nr:alpha/beta fold hydrolase [Nocardia bovistercoris]MBH0779651.1 alpha/beta fold hydrolase [Nocardia bovistercoris]
MTHQTTLLFVHGTGVRGEEYARTLRTIESCVASRNWPLTVAGCFWGSAGARRDRKLSVPNYDATKGTGLQPEQEQLERWAVLYLDPWYELRLLRGMPPTPYGGGQPPAAALRATIAAFRPSEALARLLAEDDLTDRFADALTAMRAAEVFEQAIATAPPTPLEHRCAIARALIAHSLKAAMAEGLPPLGGAKRELLVGQLVADLRGSGLGVGNFLVEQVKRYLPRPISHVLVGHRGALTDATALPAGDVLRYLARGQQMTTLLRNAILDTGSDSVVLLGHSLGGILCVDLLARERIPAVRTLVTVGSQAPFLYEIGALPSIEPPDSLPEHFPPWLNIYDHRDLLSYTAAETFPDRVVDLRVDNGEPFAASHSAYWSNDEVWTSIESVLPR